MNQATKKKIAKEVLILASTLAIIGVVLLSSKLHYAYFDNQWNHYSEKHKSTKNELDTLNKIYYQRKKEYQRATEIIEKYRPNKTVFDQRDKNEAYYTELRKFINADIQLNKSELESSRGGSQEQKKQLLIKHLDYLLDSLNVELIQETILDTLFFSNTTEKIAKLEKNKETFDDKASEFAWKSLNGETANNYSIFSYLVLILVYPVRILYLILRWAIKMVKEP